MKRTLTMMIICILCLSIFSVLAPRARALASETPLQVAEKAATWTISQAIYENGGYKWADYMQALYYDASVQYGSAGYGTLYLELYKKTGKSMYLDYAKGAAQWIISQAVPDSGGYKWPHHDDSIPSPGWWLSPAVSGIGEFLLQMYKTTGNTVYLDYATGAAQWLMAMAYWGEPGCFIPYNPPNPYGTQASHGIDPAREAYTVTFLLHMYEETGNSIYLEYVTGTAEWLISGPDKIVNPSGYEWRFNRPFYNDYPLDGEGRIALFFYEIYEALGNATYLEYARGAMNWLLNQAVVNGGTAKWFDPVPERGCYRTLPFSGSYMGGIAGFWGVPEPNELLMAVYEITNNATYLDYATKLANWITSPAMAIPEGGGYKFPDAEGGSTYSAYQNARIYNFLSWLYSVTGVTSYSEYADGALQWIIFNATETNGGYEWRTINYFPYYASWFEGGAAGIGYYLVSALALTVYAPPSANFTWSPLVPVVDDLVTFNGSSSTPDGGTIVGYAWNFGDGGLSSGEIATHVYSAVGNFAVSLNITDSEGLWDVKEHQIQVLPLPLSVSITPLDSSILLGQSVPFTSAVNDGVAPYGYQWYLNGSAFVGAALNSWTFNPATVGTYSVYLTVTDSYNSTAQSQNATVTVTPPLTVSISPLSASILPGQSVTFTSTVNGGTLPYKYQWYVGGSSVSGATLNGWIFLPSAVGIYYVHLQATDFNNITAQSETARIVVASVPVGGYSVSFDKHPIARPLTLNLALATGLALFFVAFKRKTTRRD